MIGSVPDKLLDNNGLYMHLKILNTEQAMEINSLKARLAIVEKELSDTKIECETFRCVTIDYALYRTEDWLCIAKLLIDSQASIMTVHATRAQNVPWS